ncbi:hypothetical protein Dda_7412 [Drechslerella dactyloides]|uniref:Uncharacterized protein n=1 Tax=Drechslerella dactyloides TaxID=74499 RepID=A0AAD6ITZ7_DREDA|nr:hypothetical protein Dda_7412 [Drechslerella dactyloides]
MAVEIRTFDLREEQLEHEARDDEDVRTRLEELVSAKPYGEGDSEWYYENQDVPNINAESN